MTSAVFCPPDDLVLLSDVLNYIEQREGGICYGSSAKAVLLALQEGRLTAWDGETPLPPEFWANKKECEVAQGGWRVSRAEVLTIWPDPGTDPPDTLSADEADNYTMLWDAAAEMSRANEKEIDWNWLRLMEAFWRGDLASDGLTLFWHDRDRTRRFSVLKQEEMACLLLGWISVDSEHYEPSSPMERLRHWGVKEDQEDRKIGWYFKRDSEGRVGLAVRSEEFGRWYVNLKATTPRPRALVKTKRVRVWYEEYVKGHVDKGTMTSGEDDWIAAKEKFGDGVRQAQIREMRPVCVPASWRKQGRLPSARNSVK